MSKSRKPQRNAGRKSERHPGAGETRDQVKRADADKLTVNNACVRALKELNLFLRHVDAYSDETDGNERCVKETDWALRIAEEQENTLRAIADLDGAVAAEFTDSKGLYHVGSGWAPDELDEAIGLAKRALTALSIVMAQRPSMTIEMVKERIRRGRTDGNTPQRVQPTPGRILNSDRLSDLAKAKKLIGSHLHGQRQAVYPADGDAVKSVPGTEVPNEYQSLRDCIIETSGGVMDCREPDKCYPLLEWLDRQNKGQALMGELPERLRGAALLWAAEDGLIEFGRRNALYNEAEGRHELFRGWEWVSLSDRLGGKSMHEILTQFKDHDARVSQEHSEVRWHVRLKHLVRVALAKCRMGNVGAQEPRKPPSQEVDTSDHVLKRDDKNGKRRGASRRRKRAKQTDLTENEERARHLRAQGFTLEQVGDQMSISKQRVRQLLESAKKRQRPSGRSVSTKALPTDKRGQPTTITPGRAKRNSDAD